jgi:hypothetical protein
MREVVRAESGKLSYFGRMFFGVQDGPQFVQSLRAVFDSLASHWQRGIFTGDNLITFGKNLSFLTDERFMAAIERHTGNDTERSIVWRTAVLCWAARNGLRRPGDFVECGCFRGTTARVIADVVDFGTLDRQYWLYDLFEQPPASAHPPVPELGPQLFEATRERFAEFENIRVIRGSVPGVLAEQSPERIAFLHIDMNSVEAEIGALEVLFDRVSPGGVIVLDDYGYYGYRAQRDAERAWLAARGYDAIELPTSQGLVIK